ncbi:MAG: hypothetical protein ONB16_13060, partial [candidate division KSB1 bacterium]|nr:hypothetical protein [candidate division KSB1 bacterium]
MNKLLLILLFAVLIFSSISAMDKAKFDLSAPDGAATLSKAADLGYEGQQLIKSMSEVTLIQGGYFTLGTNGGISASRLDDHCSLTFGHPYALTSYPLLAIDGTWGKIDTFFQILESAPQFQGDSLVLSYWLPNLWRFDFTLKTESSGQTISARLEFHNLDAQPHRFGLGLVFDAGLGPRGDGCAVVNSKEALRDTILVGTTVPKELLLKERSGMLQGIKLRIDLSASKPNRLILANWRDVYQNHGPQFSNSELRQLYDLVLKMLWEEQQVPGGATIAKSITFELQPPDFGSRLFMRWDAPAFLSLENNLLFPRSFDTFVDITNLTGGNLNNVQLSFQFPEELSASLANYQVSVPNNGAAYQKVTLQSSEILEDKVV